MSDIQTICLRPHHGICIQNFIGRGYDEKFTENMKAVINNLESDQDTIIRLISDSDVLCKYCPHNNGQCDSIEKVRRMDELCLKICGLSSGSYVRWSEYKYMVKKHILTTDEFDNVCGKCEWLDLCKEIKSKKLKCTK